MLTLPTPDRVTSRLEEFDAAPRVADGDAAVRLVFGQWPDNSRIEEVLAKVVVLNQLYSTQIYAVHDVARHIVGLGIDGRLRTGDPNLVESIASVTVGGNQRRHNLSFASKYCAWHRPDDYQIFDSYVENLLWVYRHELDRTELKRRQLREYSTFLALADRFVEHFGLGEFTRKEIDKFLWIEGRALERPSA